MHSGSTIHTYQHRYHRREGVINRGISINLAWTSSFQKAQIIQSGTGTPYKKKKPPPGGKGGSALRPARLQKEGRRNSSDSQPVSCHHVCPVPITRFEKKISQFTELFLEGTLYWYFGLFFFSFFLPLTFVLCNQSIKSSFFFFSLCQTKHKHKHNWGGKRGDSFFFFFFCKI